MFDGQHCEQLSLRYIRESVAYYANNNVSLEWCSACNLGLAYPPHTSPETSTCRANTVAYGTTKFNAAFTRVWCTICNTGDKWDIIETSLVVLVELTSSMAYGTRRFNAAFTRALLQSIS